MVERRIEKENQLQKNLDTSRADWEKIINYANEFLQQQKEKRLWTVKDYQIVSKSLRQSKDEKIPKQRMIWFSYMNNGKKGHHLP